MFHSRDSPRLLVCDTGLYMEQNYIGFITVAICGGYISKYPRLKHRLPNLRFICGTKPRISLCLPSEKTPYHNISWYHSITVTSYGHHGVSNHRRLRCLFNHLSRGTWKKTSKLCVTGLCEGTPPVNGGFPAQRASDAENVSIWWCHHEISNPGHMVSELSDDAEIWAFQVRTYLYIVYTRMVELCTPH